jgi:hypothetical protein
MGNACGCAEDVQSGPHFGSIKRAEDNGKYLASVFKSTAVAPKINAEAFAKLTVTEKDQTLAEVLRLVLEHGDPASLKITNPHLKQYFLKTQSTIVMKTGDKQSETFEGEVINGIANGNGTVKLVESSVYHGYFSGGFKAGSGEIKSDAQGVIHIYYGEKGLAEGITHLRLKNGSAYTYFHSNDIKEGPFYGAHPTDYEFARLVNGKKNGLSVRISKDYQLLSLDEFKDDKAVGPTKVFVKQDKSAVQTPPPANPAPQAAPAQPKPAGGQAPDQAQPKQQAPAPAPAPGPQPAAQPQPNAPQGPIVAPAK